MDNRQAQIDLIQLLLARLARISADSPWAYKASGLRGSLLRCLDPLEAVARGELPASAAPGPDRLNGLIRYGFDLLEKAAQAAPNR